jgi:hypothetical protein
VLTVATVELLVLHVPPAVGSLNDMVRPEQTLEGPVIASGVLQEGTTLPKTLIVLTWNVPKLLLALYGNNATIIPHVVLEIPVGKVPPLHDETVETPQVPEPIVGTWQAPSSIHVVPLSRLYANLIHAGPVFELLKPALRPVTFSMYPAFGNICI